MKFYNPLPWTIETMAGGKTYYFQPCSEGEVWDMDHARVLLNPDHDASRSGLVHMEFGDNLRSKFKNDFEAFRHDQIKIGLKNAYNTAKEAWINERQAEIDVKHHKTGAEADKAVINPAPFAKRYETVKDLLEKAEKPFVASVAKVEAGDNGKVNKRVYRRKTINGSVGNQNAGQTQA